MKYAILIMIALLAFGCVDSTYQPPEQKPPEEVAKTCKNVTEQVPTQVEECGEISYTEEVCGKRDLNYTATLLPIIHLCMLDGECGGKPLSECSFCAKAMTRCTLVIKNEDLKKDGTWVVGSNFTLGTSVFKRDPVTKTIEANETATFDFQHFYTPGQPISSATCKVFVMDTAEVDDCQQITRTRQECVNVTKMVPVEKEVCN